MVTMLCRNVTVSIHAPARGAMSPACRRSVPFGFNSRTREGCDFHRECQGAELPVSIHAPARGAIPPRCRLSELDSFNSRTREGCDTMVTMLCRNVTVSIHAPARGAMSPACRRSVPFGFNSRTREGCDVPTLNMSGLVVFQFTHPRGVRYEKTGTFKNLIVSIHAPARGAITHQIKKDNKELFQFTHPRGVRSFIRLG